MEIKVGEWYMFVKVPTLEMYDPPITLQDLVNEYLEMFEAHVIVSPDFGMLGQVTAYDPEEGLVDIVFNGHKFVLPVKCIGPREGQPPRHDG